MRIQGLSGSRASGCSDGDRRAMARNAMCVPVVRELVKEMVKSTTLSSMLKDPQDEGGGSSDPDPVSGTSASSASPSAESTNQGMNSGNSDEEAQKGPTVSVHRKTKETTYFVSKLQRIN